MRNAQKGGVSLLTLAIFLMLLGSMLMVGVMYLRGDQSSAEASREREALLWADNAIIGFASTYHRLPCPAEAPDGNENCALAKGWLPVKALNLDVTLFAPGLLPMRYMVYRDESSLTTEAETHRAPAIGEPGIYSDDRLLPYDAYEPAGWDHATASDVTAITTDADPHVGRFAGRFDFNNRNGLDMCETMRLVSVKLAATGSQTDFAHYLRGSTPINVAYGVALPGSFDASGLSLNRFDGANGTNNPAMEAPDKGHGSNYDDYVRVRDFDSLMSAFGCQPVRYHAEADYSHTIDGSGDINADIAGLIQTIVADTRGAPNGKLEVDINREGIATPMLESVQSVALAYGIVEEIEGQYEDLQAAVKQTVVFASVQAAVAAAGVIVSTVTLVADVIGIVQAVTAAIASLGLNFAAYVAIAAYTVSSITSGVAIGVNIAATTLLVTAAVDTSNIAARLDVDVSKEMEALCKKADLTAAQQEIVKAKQDAEEAAAREAAAQEAAAREAAAQEAAAQEAAAREAAAQEAAAREAAAQEAAAQEAAAREAAAREAAAQEAAAREAAAQEAAARNTAAREVPVPVAIAAPAIAPTSAPENQPALPLAAENRAPTLAFAPAPIRVNLLPAKPQKKTLKPLSDEEIEAQVTLLADETNAAVRAGDFAAADAYLALLEEIVPPQSLTLWRLRAWTAFNAGRKSEARRYYKRILERLDHDENAGINLAILEVQDGNRELALRILTGLSIRHPDSENIRAIRQLLGATDN
ncbi:hypothetical protein FACS1894101_2890 [Betaproteobacteria bacterium]|nr:hypothetical protein FACS1894101_2890 [Betaproteobacteria bacterium]